MMRISFELFPPKTSAGLIALNGAVRELAAFKPEFFSVTSGALGGSTSPTPALVREVQGLVGCPVYPHQTGISLSQALLADLIAEYQAGGIKGMVVLRGDAPVDQAAEQGAYPYALDLLGALKKEWPELVCYVSAYPEKHPEAKSLEADLQVLKQKQDAGASAAITQFFFDVELYVNYVKAARAAGVTLPIIPGLLPIGNFNKMCAMAARCGASVPEELHERFAHCGGDSVAEQKLAITIAKEQFSALKRLGVEQVHFYTLNRADLCQAVLAG